MAVSLAQCVAPSSTSLRADRIDFGIARDEFLNKYFEKSPLLCKQAVRAPTFKMSDVDALLYQVEPVAPFVKLYKEGEVAPDRYVDNVMEYGLQRRRLNKHAFYGLLHAGATLVLNRLEVFSLEAKRLCAQVARYAGQQTLSNAYLAFHGSGTFGLHWDTHDVFAIQLIGKKRWQLYAPTLPLPLSFQTSGQSPQPPTTQAVIDCVLNEGDVLYIPRGWWHRAMLCDGPSFHISVGTYAPTVMDYVMWLAQRHLPQLYAARVGLTAETECVQDADKLARVIAEALHDPNELAAFKKITADRERVSSEFDLGLYLDPNAQALTLDTRVSANISWLKNSAGVVINGKLTPLDAIRSALLDCLSQTESLSMREIYQRLSSFSNEGVRDALMDLSLADLIAIHRVT